MKKRVLSLLVAVVILLGMLPMTAFADGTHTHCICGASHTSAGEHTAEQSVTWTEWNGTGDIAYTDGVAYVYLAMDVARDSTLTVADGCTLNLCLNGKKLSYTGSGAASVLTVEEGATLVISDCGVQTRSGYIDAGTHLWTEGSSASVDDETCDLVGGVISGGTGSNASNANDRLGGAIYNGGTVYMYGGNIAGNSTLVSAWYYDGYGAAVYNLGSFYMYGGTVTGNSASAHVVYVPVDCEGKVVISGSAAFRYNYAKGKNPMISSDSGTMEISGNASFSNFRGPSVIDVNACSLTIKDNVSIVNNEVYQAVYVYFAKNGEATDTLFLGGNVSMRNAYLSDPSRTARDISFYNCGRDPLITVVAPLTNSYTIHTDLESGAILAKADGVNLLALTEEDAARFVDEDGALISGKGGVVCIGCVIIDHPTADNSYQINASGNPTYQWAKHALTEIPVAAPEDSGPYSLRSAIQTSSTKNVFGFEDLVVSDFWDGNTYESNYDRENGQWIAYKDRWNYEELDAFYFEAHPNLDGTLRITLSRELKEYESLKVYLTQGESQVQSEILPNADGSYSLERLTESYSYCVCILRNAPPDELAEEHDYFDYSLPTISATFTSCAAYEILDGQTAAKLDVTSLSSGVYSCLLTWDLGDGDVFSLVTTPAEFERYYTVTLDYGTLASEGSVSVLEGERISLEDPAIEGYSFKGWFADEDFATAFDFTAPITADTTVYAKLVSTADDGVDSPDSSDGSDGTNNTVGTDGVDGANDKNGAVVAIVIGGIALVGTGAVIVWIFLKKKKKEET